MGREIVWAGLVDQRASESCEYGFGGLDPTEIGCYRRSTDIRCQLAYLAAAILIIFDRDRSLYTDLAAGIETRRFFTMKIYSQYSQL